MENVENKQHVQVPNKMADHNLTPRDQYIYSVIKSHDGKSGCFPSLKTISTESNCSINTVRKSISSLEEAGYITTKKVGRQQYYFFSKYKKFEPISPEFLKNENLSVKEKSYIIASQQYMYKDTENYGKVSFPVTHLSKLINMPESSIRQCNESLKNKGFLTEVINNSIELDGSGHYEPQGMSYDSARSAFLTALGLEVLRFSNQDVDKDFRGVCTQIDSTIQKRLQDPLSHLR